MKSDVDAELERLRALEVQDYKEKEVDRLQKQFGKEPELTDGEKSEADMNAMWESRGIPVKNIRERNGSTEA